ncbi:DUF4192 domain-containing protein [Streptomyces sp. NPDC004647]|uniref:DUF4192 domain-containing protein n=1 Tax=Streptomyces sp. NPDC004647 TaxID=3154671 RepID=UPI0033AB1829
MCRRRGSGSRGRSAARGAGAQGFRGDVRHHRAAESAAAVDHRGVDPADETAELLRPVNDWIIDALVEHRGAPQQSIGLVAGRWWAFTCELPGCCEGEPLPALDDPNSAAAQLIQLGYAPGRRTREIVKEFQPIDPEHAPHQLSALDNEGAAYAAQCAAPEGQDAALDATHSLLETAMRDFRAGATELADDIAARLIHGLHDDWARDHGLEFSEDDDLPYARRLWAFLARRCIAPHTNAAVPALTLLAWVTWRQTDLPTARLALKKALTTDPSYELAEVLHGAINSKADPQGLLAIARNARDARMNRAKRTDSHTH